MQNVRAPIIRQHVLMPLGVLLPATLLLCVMGVMAGCSSSSSGPATPTGGVIEPGPDQEDDTRVPVSLLQLEEDPELVSEIPEILVTITTAGVGVQVAYTRQGQDELVPAEQVEAQWIYMQDCLGQSGVSPVVVVREGSYRPFTQSDDVIFDIEGATVASGTQRAIPILQIQESDFDVSVSNPGFNLRSIMGRLLWLSAGLPERDYPFECARQQPS